jgi:hypothetical protein
LWLNRDKQSPVPASANPWPRRCAVPLGHDEGGGMASWVECKHYTETRGSVWVNLEQAIRAHANGSVFMLPVPNGQGAPVEVPV